MSRKFLRPSLFWLLLVSAAIGRIVLPKLSSTTPAVQAFVPATDPCQTELNELNQAAQELADAEEDLDDALITEEEADAAHYQCEYNTPGMCSQEEQDAANASAAVAAAQVIVDAKAQSLNEKQYAYDECRYGGP